MRDPAGNILPFDPPGPVYTGALSINDGGTVAGSYEDGGGRYHGFVRDPAGNILPFDPRGSVDTLAFSINDGGAIAGYAFYDGFHGFVRDPGGNFVTFDTPDLLYGHSVFINDGGTVAGSYGYYGPSHGFVRDPAGNILPFDPRGSIGTRVDSINDSGAVAGFYVDGVGSYHGFVRDPAGNIEPFDAPGPGYIGALSINDNGTVVGSYGSSHGFVRDPAGNIEPFDPPGSVATKLFSINDRGAVAGYNDGHGFVLEPAFTALGDSYSSGEGARPYDPGTYLSPYASMAPPNHCHRSSGKTWSALAAKDPRAPTPYVLHACSGAVIDDFYFPFDENHPGENHGERQQLEWLNDKTKLVTLSIGGNDAHFGDVMEYCALHPISTTNCKDKYENTEAVAIKALTTRLPILYSNIHARAPNAGARDGLPEVLPPSPPNTCRTGVPTPHPFNYMDMKWINDTIAKVDDVIHTAVRTQTSFRYVDAYDAFRGHELCTAKPYLHDAGTGFFNQQQQESFHPNTLGYARLSDLAKAALP